MKLLVLVCALSLAAIQPAAAQPLESAAGLWSSEQGRAEIRIVDCNGALCGDLISAAKIQSDPELEDQKNADPELRKRKLRGLRILRDFIGGPTEWRGGSVYNPDDGNTYRGVIKLINDHTLKLTGCVIWPLCKSARLTRASIELLPPVTTPPAAAPAS